MRASQDRRRWVVALAVLTILLTGSAGSAPVAQSSEQAQSVMYLPLLRRHRQLLLPPDAQVAGYTAAEVGRRIAAANFDGREFRYPSDLPFTILNAEEMPVVARGAPFYLLLMWVVNSTLLDTFPSDSSGAAAYIVDTSMLGCRTLAISIDGDTYPVGPSYVAGPYPGFTIPTIATRQYLTVGAFVAPLPPGEHTITRHAVCDGEVLLAQSGGIPSTINETHRLIVE